MDGEPPAKRRRREQTSTTGTKRIEDVSTPVSRDHSTFEKSKQMHSTDKGTAIEDCYRIVTTRPRYIKHFKTDVIEHIIHLSEVSVNQCMHERQGDSYGLFHELFENIIDKLIRTFQERDRVLLEINLPSSERPIFVPLMEVQQVNAEAILLAFEQVQQSNSKIKLDGKMEVQVIHIEVPDGRGDGHSNENEFLKGKRSVIRIQNKDNMCLARALVTARARLEYERGDKSVNWENIRKGLGEQTRLAKELQKSAGVFATSPNILDDVPKFQAAMKNYQILVVPMSGYKECGFLYKGPVDLPEKLYILFSYNHFDVISSIKGFLDCGYFCERCWKGYKTFEHHSCNNMCTCCFNNDKDGCILVKWIKCDDCSRLFKSDSCYDRHKKVPEAMANERKPSQAKTVCDRIKWCVQCQRTIKDQHKCGFEYCRKCKTHKELDHLCYMQPIGGKGSPEENKGKEADNATGLKMKSSNKVKEQVYIFFDFESRQDQQGDNEENLHTVNYCVAQRVCGICMHRENLESSCDNCDSLEKCFKGDHALEEFCKWLFSRENCNAIAIAHNMKGYDGHFILKYLFQIGKSPQVIKNGCKLMVIEVQKLKIIDSLNFIPFPLSAFSKTFDIKGVKGYFPHLFNTKANEDYKGNWPDRSYYDPEQMKTKERNDFNKWYEQQVEKEFDMSTEINVYCKNDVTLLRLGCSHFRSIFLQTTKEDPFQTNLTIASACMRFFRRKFLKKDTIAIVPHHGYKGLNQSFEAIHWLQWMEHSQGVCIQHSGSGGEKKFDRYKVDGFCKKTDTIYEFYGCFWHGCPICFSNRKEKHHGGVSMEDRYQRHLTRRKVLKEYATRVQEIWECEYRRQLRTNSDMKDFVDSLDITRPLEPRDAFYGGRTNAIKLYHSVKRGERIRYIDVCSLYPWVNKYGKYPVGHPEIITEDLTTDIQRYEGLIKCTILPPGDLFHPVLPYRCDGKLLFPLCATCAKDRSIGNCLHSDDKRALRGTWVTDEIKKAVEKGYRVTKVHEVWHFKETSQYESKTKQGGLFTEYVDTFLKLKQEADGWPSDCQTDLKKSEFINEYRDKEGIDLNADDIKRNAGKRALAKLMLNSFWGKFGQRPNLPQTEYVGKLDKYYEILRNDTKVIKGMSFVSDSMVQIQWQDKDETVESMPYTNVYIAAYTTALARLKLYSYLEKLERRVLYFDTDSIIYVSNRGVQGEYEPPTGKFLGDMTDELEKAYGKESYITDFVSWGPKSYSYKAFNPKSWKDFFECKQKGLTINFETSKLFNFEVMKENLHRDMCDNDSSDEYRVGQLSQAKTPIQTKHIVRSKKGNVVTKACTKTYRVVADKRRVKKDFSTLPFGFKSE